MTPIPHINQHPILDSSARNNVVVCGRRFGKTVVASIRTIKRMLDGQSVGFFGPVEKTIGQFWDFVYPSLPPEIITYKNENDHVIKLVTGGRLQCWSLNKADSIRSRGLNHAIFDEAAYVTDLERKYNAVVSPMLLDHEGSSDFYSTTNGYDYLYQLYQRGLDPNYADWKSFLHTSYDNPLINPNELDRLRNEMPDRWFRQEYMAEFIEDAGGVFRGVKDVSTAQPREPYKGNFVFGVDWGRSNDFTAIHVFDMDSKTEVAMDRFNVISWSLQRERLVNLYNQWQPQVIIAEENSIGSPNIEALQDEGLPVTPFQTTANSKTPLIDSFSLAIERKEITLLNDPIAMNELQAYQMKRMPSGRWQYTAPDGLHDDTVIARALAYYGFQNMTPLLMVW